MIHSYDNQSHPYSPQRKVDSISHQQVEISTTNTPNGLQTVVSGTHIKRNYFAQASLLGSGLEISRRDLVEKLHFVRNDADLSFRKDGDCLLETVAL